METKETRQAYVAPEIKPVTIQGQGVICTSPGFGSGDGGYNEGGNYPI